MLASDARTDQHPEFAASAVIESANAEGDQFEVEVATSLQTVGSAMALQNEDIPHSSEVKKVGGGGGRAVGQNLHMNLQIRFSGCSGGGRWLKSADVCVEVCPAQEIVPGYKAVLYIDAGRAADLQYTFGQQVRVKEVKGDLVFVGFDGHNAREAWVNAGEVSITQAGLNLHQKPGWGGFEKCNFQF